MSAPAPVPDPVPVSIPTLDTQEAFEELWFGRTVTPGTRFIVWFSAKWCRPCQNMDRTALVAAAATARMSFFYCDAAVNQYTSGYCKIKSFPTFIVFEAGSTHADNKYIPGRIVDMTVDSRTELVCRFLTESR